ncbi:unnamed protein product [Phytophthora lilii]|uniref:Unnamed protein product n=1 Tax=Phytophthora lilii TaxID=2077276 RepID=A0A9W6TZC0_9STRA|nr:unnamed protein product [Phytophthora lilii]
MKQVEQQEAERMEQSIRFTVLDPLQARLERHDQLREEINARDKLAAESKLLRETTLKMQSSKLEDDDRRAQTELNLHKVAAALLEAEEKLLPQLGWCIIVKHTPSSVSLSTTTSKLSKMSSLTSDGWTEVDESSSSTPDGVETVSGSDEDEECNASSITLEDFEAAKVPQTHKRTVHDTKVQEINRPVDAPKTDTLALYPVVSHNANDDETREDSEEKLSRLRRSTSPSPRTANFQPIAPRRTASMFWSIRKTIRGKFSYSSGHTRMIRQNSAPVIDTPLSDNQSRTISPRKSPTEWHAIEDCLWEIDIREAKSLGKSILTADSIGSNSAELLCGLLQKVCYSKLVM